MTARKLHVALGQVRCVAAPPGAADPIGRQLLQPFAASRAEMKALARAKARLAMVLAAVVAAAGAGTGAFPPLAGRPPRVENEAASRGGERAPGAPRLGEEAPARADRCGDPLPPGAVARLGTVRFRHTDSVSHVVFSPDGKVVISCGCDAACRLWDAATGEELLRVATASGGPGAVALAPDGKVIAVEGKGGAIDLREAHTGRLVRRMEGTRDTVLSLAFHPSGKALASAEVGRTVQVWDVTAGRPSHRLSGEGRPAFSPDGRLLAAGDKGGAVVLWDVATGKEVRRTGGVYEAVRGVAFAPDGRTLAAAGPSKGGSVRLWDVATGKELCRLGAPADRPSVAVAFSPDGKAVIAGGYLQPPRAWDVATGKELRRFRGPGVNCLAFSPDGRTVAGGTGHSVVLWDFATGREVRPGDAHLGGVRALALSPDGRLVASCSSDRTVRLWDLAAGKPLRTMEGHEQTITSVAFSPDSKFVASGAWDETARVWEAATGREVRKLAPGGMVAAVAFSPDGKVLATGGSHCVDGAYRSEDTLFLWDMATGKKLRRLGGGQHSIRGLAFSPDGVLLASADGDCDVRLWEVATGREVRRLQNHSCSVTFVAFSPCGRQLASGDATALRLWDVAAGKEVGRLESPQGKPQPGEKVWRGPGAAAFSPDDRALATTGRAHTLSVWELATRGERRRFTGPEGGASAVAFSPDGRLLVTGGTDTTVLVWDVTGMAGARQARVAPATAAELDALWDDLAAEDASHAGRALAVLAAAPGQSVPLLRGRLRPGGPDPRRVARLIAGLDDDDFAVRERSTGELAKLGEAAAPALRRSLEESPSPEMQLRVRGLLGKLGGPKPDPERLRRLRSVEVLELAATSEARQLLEAVAGDGSETELAREAKAALGRLPRGPR